MRHPLERVLSKLGLASRTAARALIEAGKVKVDGRVVRDPLRRVELAADRIEVEGKKAETPRFFALMLHKPRGAVTTARDEKGRQTVYAYLEDAPARVVPVGRLDQATTGLLIFTTDTRLSDWLTDPRNAIPRVYLVTVRGEVSDETARELESGIRDEAELLRARKLLVRKRSRRESHLVVELDEGKNREIRRLLAARGHEVTKLKRVAFGGLELGELEVGKWRELSVAELKRAFPGAPVGGGGN